MSRPLIVLPDLRYQTTLRPWRQVARLYNQRTGEHLTGEGCRFIAHQALRKLRALANAGNLTTESTEGTEMAGQAVAP